MSTQRDPISVRTTRLNNLIVGKKGASNSGVLTPGPGVKISRRSISGVSSSFVSPVVAEALNREGLLDAFCLLYNECDKEALKKRDKNIAEFVTKYRSVIDETTKLRVNAHDFALKAVIGKGYFGNVHLVSEKQTGDIYAMKKIKKSVITTSQVKEERDIMCRRASEWITNLQYAFQDTDNLYLIMEFLPGGDLLGLMTRNGPFDEDLARFYLAELSLAINALHSMGYVHRDIKPENILIDRFGHIKLADFGNAAALDRDGHVMSLSPVGTPDYIAPELLQTISTYKLTKSMHDVSCDYWSMGIIGYELICEITPFHEDNVHETYSKILSHCEESQLKEIINFPSDLKLSTNFKNLILSLITNPTDRLSFEKIKKHPYFETVKWDSLRSQVPPIIPNVKSDDDISNFEDTTRQPNKAAGRSTTFVKKSLSTNMKSNDFCGKDLPFIGYTFVHMEKQSLLEETTVTDESRFNKLNAKIKELQTKLKERLDEISHLKQELLRAEQMAKQSNSHTKLMQDAKEEIIKMKNTIKEKTIELAACKTKIKTLQSSVKIEEEMWAKKEATITELLRLNRQKYEEAKIASEQRYEKLIAEKKNELIGILQKLDARENELTAKNEECTHLQEKIENYKDMLRQFKEQSQADKVEFENNKMQLTAAYEVKLMEMRNKLRQEKDTKSRLTMELRDVRHELDDSISSSKSSEVAKITTEKNNDKILQRLNCEIESNNALHAQNVELEKKLAESQKISLDHQQEIGRLERELKLAEVSKDLAESTLVSQSPFQTAPGSLTELHATEEQLRADLEAAKENENVQRVRAEKLQEIVEKLEMMMEKFNENALSPTKPHPAPRQMPSSVGDMLERQNEKLEDKLAAVREQMIVERQAARTANLALWKVEKQLEETLAEKKMTQRRMELTEERIKKVQNERDEAQRLCKQAQSEKQQNEERLMELREEIASLKRDVLKEHRMWEKSEQERMKAKSEIIEHIAGVHKLEERLSEIRSKLQQTQQKCDTLGLENKRLIRELNEEREKSASANDTASEIGIKMKNLQDNYERLKYACTVTDNQLTEVESMLEAEQKRNVAQQEKIEKLYSSTRQKDDTITILRKELHEEQAQKKDAEVRIKNVCAELDEHKMNLQEMQEKLISQQQQLMEQTSNLFKTQERVEILTADSNNLQTLNKNLEREISLLKEENARILSDLFHAKEEVHNLQVELKEALTSAKDLHAEIDELQSVLAEKENFFLQRDIKSEATLAQHKKLIDYLQLKVEDLSQKKKKTLADKLFGGNTASAKKENISPNAVEQSILYRTLQEELRREKQRCKSLQEQIDKLNGTSTNITGTIKSPTKSAKIDEKQQENSATNTISKSPNKTFTTGTTTRRRIYQTHRFELSLLEGNTNDNALCVACKKVIMNGSPYWKCKACKECAHRKCRSDVNSSCDGGAEIITNIVSKDKGSDQHSAKIQEQEMGASSESELDAISLGKYSYEGKLNAESDEAGNTVDSNGSSEYGGTLIYSVGWNSTTKSQNEQPLEVNCAYEMEEQKVLLLGCNSGLYAYHMDTHNLVHIAGIDSVNYIAISLQLAKAILVGSHGESLYQCDFRHLQTRSQANACLKPALEASVLDLPFANRACNEKWQLVKISHEADNALDSVAIAATSTRIVILKYELKMQKFKPVRALDTATPVSSILYTRHTAIVSSDKFFEIDLDTYAAEEFVDMSDQSLSHTSSCQPVVALRISRQEFLLCFMECGIFVDEYGCRSRPYDLNWEYTPTGFLYREPFLYISHFQSIQIMRLHRSFSKEINSSCHKDIDADIDDHSLTLKRAYIKFYMPSLLAEGGKFNVYSLSIQKDAGLQQIYHLDAMQAFREKFNESMETISSTATSITTGSIGTTDSI